MEKPLALQAFWNAVEQRLTAYSAEELRAIVRALAQATPATERQAFLESMPPLAEAGAVMSPEPLSEALLADTVALADELQRATAEAEGWDEYHEEDSLGPYAAFVEPLTALFDRAAAAFDAGNVTLARTAYQHLFETLSYEDDYGRGVRAEDLQAVTLARPRSLREPYTIPSHRHRPAVLFEAMQQVRSWLATPAPCSGLSYRLPPAAA